LRAVAAARNCAVATIRGNHPGGTAQYSTVIDKGRLPAHCPSCLTPGRLYSEPSPLRHWLFDLRGVALPAWTLIAFVLGVLAGMLNRRVVPAIVATLAVRTVLAVFAGDVLRANYQPVSEFWRVQWIEGASLLALSVLLVAVTVTVVRRRAA